MVFVSKNRTKLNLIFLDTLFYYLIHYLSLLLGIYKMSVLVQAPSYHISSKGLSFILGDGPIESAVEDIEEKVKKEENEENKKKKNTSCDFVINFTSYNKKQDKKTSSIDTFYGFIVSLFKF